jgi:hypothetical protein
MSTISLAYSQQLLAHFGQVAAHYRRAALWLKDDKLVKQLDGQIASMNDMAEQMQAGFRQLQQAIDQIENIRAQIDDKCIANAQTALLESRQSLSSSPWSAADILEEAVLYRQEAGLVNDPNRSKALQQRALQLVRVAEQAMRPPDDGNTRQTQTKRRTAR